MKRKWAVGGSGVMGEDVKVVLDLKKEEEEEQ